jgi:starch synthase
MPSRFEPCGLNQLYAMRYGTLPIAHATGGLKDTITAHNSFGDVEKVLSGTADLQAGEGVGTGWLFNDMNSDALMWAIRSACDVYRNNPKMWRAMQTQAMTQDLSWDAAGLKWEQIFEWAKIDKPWCQ